MKTILVVCTANICRSPMAEAILRRRVREAGLDSEIEVLSAGVRAQPGYPASGMASQLLRMRDMSLTEHESQPITPAMIARADLVLVMEEAHRRSLFYSWPEHLRKVYLLAEMAGEHDDVADPWGGIMQEYVETADLLERLIDQGMPQILSRLGIPANVAGTSGA